MEKMARRDAVKLLVQEFDRTVKAYNDTHLHQMQSPVWEMPIRMSVGRWRAIIEALRPLSED